MNHENKFSTHIFNNDEKHSFLTYTTKFGKTIEEESSITPKRPLLSRDRIAETLIDISPLTDFNYRPSQSLKHSSSSTTFSIPSHSHSLRINESQKFTVSPPRSTIDNDENCDLPLYIPRKARPAPPSTWKAPLTISKSSTMLKTNLDHPVTTSPPVSMIDEHPPIASFQPAIRPRVPFNLSSSNTIEKQTHAFTLWLNTLFTPVEYFSNPTNSTIDQTSSSDDLRRKCLKNFAESTRWYSICDRAREVFAEDIQPIAAKISADIDIENCRINPKLDLNFSSRTVSRQALLNFLSSYNRIWFRLAMEIVFPVKIDHYQQMKFAIDQYLIQTTMNNPSPPNEITAKKTIPKLASTQIRLTIKNLLIMIIFLERAKILRLIDNDPCLFNRESKFKSTKEALDILSRDFISSDTNLLRRLKLAGYEATYRQTSFDEFNYLINTNQENKLFEDLKDGIRLTRCAQILLSSTNEQIGRLDLSTRLKCPVVNLVHKLSNIDQAFDLFQNYGDVQLNGISNKDVMQGNKQRILELLWRIFIGCYLPKQLSPIDRLANELTILKKNLSNYSTRNVFTNDLLRSEKASIVHLLIEWVQLICAHYKFWIYDLQESFADGRAFLFIISYYLPSLCDYHHDIKHLTTLATCQTREEHLQFNHELSQQQSTQIYERNVKGNFRLLEELIKQFASFSSEFVKYEFYGKDLPDERCTLMILAMLAHDLLFFNTPISTNEFDYRSQPIFDELKEKYVEDHRRIFSREEIEIITENSFHPSTITTSTEIPIEITNVLREEEEETSSSIIQTMNQDILDRLDSISEWLDESAKEEESFNTARSASTTMFHQQRVTMASMSLDDFVELEKTIENEEMRNNFTRASSCFIDETILSEVDSLETNKSGEASFTDPHQTKMLKETMMLFLNNEQQPMVISTNQSIPTRLQTTIEQQTNAAIILQSFWRGHSVRRNNQLNHHPIVSIFKRISTISSSSLTLRERMVELVREYSDISSSSVTAYLHLIRAMKPLVTYSLELRHLIAEQGLLRLFFILMKCCNRSEPSNALLNEILTFFNLFTVNKHLTMKLVDKTEQIKDFNMLILKYYQNNGWELFEQICDLLQSIVRHYDSRQLLRTTKSFTDAIEYVYKRLFNKASLDEEKYSHRARSTPKQSADAAIRRMKLFNPTPKLMRSSIVFNENINTKNLLSIEKLMKVFYSD